MLTKPSPEALRRFRSVSVTYYEQEISIFCFLTKFPIFFYYFPEILQRREELSGGNNGGTGRFEPVRRPIAHISVFQFLQYSFKNEFSSSVTSVKRAQRQIQRITKR